MGNCQQIVEITVNLTHDCGVRIPQTPFVEPLGVIHVAGRRRYGRRGQRLGAAAAVGRVAWQQPNGGPTTATVVAAIRWRQR